MEAMAAVSKLTKEKKIALSFKKRFDQLGCPFTDSVEDSWILELIFRPGEPRIRLLQWLLTKFDSKLSDVLDPQYAPSDTKMDSRIQRLLYVASSLGLCKPDEADLVRGVSSESRQLAFMDNLLDYVCIMDTSEDPQAYTTMSPSVVHEGQSLREQSERDCQFIDALAENQRMETMFLSKVKLLPPDIMKHVEEQWKEKGHNPQDSPPLPDIKYLLELTQSVTKDLERQNEILKELVKHHKMPEKDENILSKVHRTVRLVLSEQSQLVTGFSYCFENEMNSWCGRPPPHITDLGQSFRRVHTLLQQFTQLLQSLTSIRSSYVSLCGPVKDSIQSLGEKDSQDTLLKESLAAMSNMQGCIDVLDESMLQRETSVVATNRTLNMSVVKLDGC